MPKPKRDTKQAVMVAIEPHTMSLPAMDRPSVALAWFMDNMRVEVYNEDDTCLVCSMCGDVVCSIEYGDTLRVLFNTALAHGC